MQVALIFADSHFKVLDAFGYRRGKVRFSVKLCGFVFKRKHVLFVDPGSYSVKSLVFQFRIPANAIEFTQITKPEYDFDFDLSDEYAARPRSKVMLIYPVPLGVFRLENNAVTPSYPGDVLPEGTLYNKSKFFEMMQTDH